MGVYGGLGTYGSLGTYGALGETAEPGTGLLWNGDQLWSGTQTWNGGVVSTGLIWNGDQLWNGSQTWNGFLSGGGGGGGGEVPEPELTKQLIWPESARSGPFVPQLDGAHRLWMFKGRSPQWAHSILVWESGLIEQLESPTVETLNRPELRLWIKGGSDFRVAEDSELYEWLTSVGYEFRDVEVTA
jgi:hypothetical protein